MRRRLVALLCIAVLALALLGTATHDHVSEIASHSHAHACLLCTGAIEAAPPEPPAFHSRIIAVLPRPPAAAPCVPWRLDPAHSGNAPPSSPVA